MIEIKNDLIEWIESTYDLEILQKFLDLKNNEGVSTLISEINADKVVEDDFDQQFAAGMTPDELMENIAAHIESISSEDPSSVFSDIQSEYVLKDDFDERFSKGISSEESRKRTHSFIESLPWKK